MTKQVPMIKLNDGVEIPAVGFGTATIKGSQGVNAFTSAISNGYRLLDSAYNYENEGAVGEAIRRSGLKREELFVTSKLPGRYHHYDEAIKAIQESLFRANLHYLDLYLIHWPNPKQDHYVEAWQALIDAKKMGLIRSIGVSNFLPEHIDRLEKETGEIPSVNQVELHPFFNQKEQRDYHEQKGILTESWSPLCRAEDVLENDVLQKLATKYNKSVGQIILRWHYQLGSIAIPRSSNPTRQRENLEIFDFSIDKEDIDAINGLTQPNGRMNDQDPAVYEEF
ncbi:aldo/keto reductase [Saliterribacillus persicus]|uniref:Diketogulonate reductase-like aldo/keto reductase n=1 Tax=Saliterribacillus persicus TaxID=930114 RepID=A0A368Y9U5_9BACI|nr:aldo/keto reductase [Saliterribacillus persicus]RCW74964.1 diketogulonate reductase-like aldo/keto reductase [Saliterribacillus persicus]